MGERTLSHLLQNYNPSINAQESGSRRPAITLRLTEFSVDMCFQCSQPLTLCVAEEGCCGMGRIIHDFMFIFTKSGMWHPIISGSLHFDQLWFSVIILRGESHMSLWV